MIHLSHGEEEVIQSKLNPQEIIDLCKKGPITHFKQLPWREGGYNLEWEEVALIAPHLCTSSLKHLDLFSHYAGGQGGLVLAEQLKKCTSLTHLDLGGNILGDNASLAILNTLVDFNIPIEFLQLCTHPPAPQVLSAFTRLISTSTTLRHLYFPANTGLEPFFQALKKNTTLQTLHIYHRDSLPPHLVYDCFEYNTTITQGSGHKVVKRCAAVNKLCQQLNATESERKSIPRQMNKIDEIEAFLKELIRTGEQWNAAKLILLGHGEVGKTALLKSIRAVQEDIKNRNKWFFQKARDWLFTSRTIGIDQSTLVLKDGEISVWDFGGQLEYAVTHQFFLSDQMAVYLICFNLTEPANVQLQQIAYWLDFLQSALPPFASTSAKSKWKIILVGTKLDLCASIPQHDSFLASWRTTWFRLPIHHELFLVSSKLLSGVDKVFFALEDGFSYIFSKHTIRIPKSFKSLLDNLQAIPEQQAVQSMADLFQHHSLGMELERFELAITYLHSIGRVVRLQGDLVCTAPKMIPGIAAKFISPADVRMKLISDQVEILEEQQVGSVLTIQDDSKRLTEELKLLEHLKVCFRLAGHAAWLFPSLASKLRKVCFFTGDSSQPTTAALRFTAPQGSIFIPGFFCQFVVAMFAKLSVS